MTAAQKAAQARFKKAVKIAADIRKKNPKLTQAEAVKKAFSTIGAPAKKAAPAKKTAPKKKAAPAKKAAKKSCVTDHRDSKSHNVNIRVMSGINTEFKERDHYERKLIMANRQLHLLKLNKNLTAAQKQEIKELPKYISKLKKQLDIQNRFLKSLKK